MDPIFRKGPLQLFVPQCIWYVCNLGGLDTQRRFIYPDSRRNLSREPGRSAATHERDSEASSRLSAVRYKHVKLPRSPYMEGEQAVPQCCSPLKSLRWAGQDTRLEKIECNTPINDNIFTRLLVWILYDLFTLADDDDDLPDLWRKSVPVPCSWLPFFIKAGQGVRLEEAHLTRHAAQLLRDNPVDVPRVYCAFKRSRCRTGGLLDGIRANHQFCQGSRCGHGEETFILMSRFPGVRLHERWDHFDSKRKDRILQDVKRATQILKKDQHTTVSSLQGWPLHHPCFPTTDQTNAVGPYPTLAGFHRLVLQYASDVRITDKEGKTRRRGGLVGFQHHFLCSKWHVDRTFFTHGDLGPFNILVDEKGKCCIIDWETAGYWPGYFEYAMSSRYQVSRRNTCATPWTDMGVRVDDAIPVHHAEKRMLNALHHYYKSEV